MKSKLFILSNLIQLIRPFYAITFSFQFTSAIFFSRQRTTVMIDFNETEKKSNMILLCRLQNSRKAQAENRNGSELNIHIHLTINDVVKWNFMP